MEPALHAFVMAGGTGTRLRPLTDVTCKPALPFAADHRVIDFVLANFRNSGVCRVEVLIQDQPQALIEHLRRRWTTGPGAADPFAALPVAAPPRPEGRAGPAGYLGTADAVFQALVRTAARDTDLVAVFGADHVYRMDLRQMLRQHREGGADVSVAVLPVAADQARGFGIVETDADGRVLAFHEKPPLPVPMPGRPSHALASMGNYLFPAGVLRAALTACCAAGRFDFGHDVLPYLLGRCDVRAYDFGSHAVPGLGPGEEPSYWRDVGTLDAYFQAQMDTLGPAPRFALDPAGWPLSQRAHPRPPAQTLKERAWHSRLGAGARVEDAVLDHAVVGAGARVGARARLERCVLFDHVSIGPDAQLRKVIVSAGNAVPAGERIGVDPVADRERFQVTAGGVVVVPPNHFPHAVRTARVAALPAPR